MKKREGKEKLIVIGNGMAGAAFLEEVLKYAQHRFDITVFGAERHNYNRVLLSSVLAGDKTVKEITVHDERWYRENNVRLVPGALVEEIRRGPRTVAARPVNNGGGEEALKKGDGPALIEERYDRLVLATGALPIIPALPGMDKQGVVAFRTLDDCERIRGAVKKGGSATVIGGGLLGLEAAKGLAALGMDVTVVHLMDRLMERQLDTVSASFLKEDIERLGITVLLGKETVAIEGGERAEEVRFRDGSSVKADLVVVSIGIRPNDSIARKAGIYCKKGIVVNDCMQTYDPSVFAIGECVEHRGSTFGLVAPIFEQARVLANHMSGDARLIFRNQPPSCRLKVPGIDLYSAGEIEEGEGAETVQYLDSGSRRYKKLIIRDGRLKGIVMYGDTFDGPSLYSSLVDGEDITHRRHSLLFAESGGRGGAASPIELMPDDSIVCGCNGVTKKTIAEAIANKGLFTKEDVKRETKAGSSCGGCLPTVERILEAVLGANYEGRGKEGLCPCTKYTRDDVIKNIRERRLKTVSDVMETLGWESVGCEECRPAINYYIGMIWPGEGADDPASRLINERAHANIQNDGTFSVVPRMPGGVVSAGELKRIAETAAKHSVPLIKLTGGQRIGLFGIKREDLKDVWRDLDMSSGYAYGKAVRTVKSCVGSAFCRYGTQDSLSLAIELEKRIEGLWAPAKLKLAVSGCPRNCAEYAVKDLGILSVTGGFEVYAGGSCGIELAKGELLATVKTPEEAIDIATAFIQMYREEADYGERTFKWVRRTGIRNIKKAVVEDKTNREKLIERLSSTLSTSTDPWKERTAAL